MPTREPGGDLYAVLGVLPSATAEAITSAFRARVRELRPDTRLDAATAARFGEVRAAYETLRDPALRAAYDQRCAHTLPASDRRGTPSAPARPAWWYAVAPQDADREPPLRAGPVRWSPGR